ncbi:MAG: hypothetical protein WBA89_19010 [Microcoleus sp.]
MFTLIDIGYFAIRSGSNWICWGKLRAIELMQNYRLSAIASGG